MGKSATTMRGLDIDVEILQALNSLCDKKAPGVDGFNTKFFKHTGSIVERDVKKVVREFFETKRIYPAINCTLVTLIPKTPNAKKMGEMRPISCCTMYNLQDHF